MKSMKLTSLLYLILCIGSVSSFEEQVSVSQVSRNSATLKLNLGAFKLHNGEVKLTCNGQNTYVDASGKENVDYMSSVQVAPYDVGTILMSELHPNTKYSCALLHDNNDIVEMLTDSIHFTTLYSDPVAPAAPVVDTTSNEHISDILQISLAPTSTKNGPISGYELQFFVVLPHEVASGKISRPIIHQLGEPHGSRESAHDAIASSEPVDFTYKSYGGSSLPNTVRIGTSLLNGALKTDTTYAVILLAYTEDTVQDHVFYSASPFSKFFTTPHRTMVAKSFSEEYRSALKYIIFGGALPVLAVGGIIVSLVIIWKVRRGRKAGRNRQQTFRRPVLVPHRDRQSKGYRPLVNEEDDPGEGTRDSPTPRSIGRSPHKEGRTAHFDPSSMDHMKGWFIPGGRVTHGIRHSLISYWQKRKSITPTPNYTKLKDTSSESSSDDDEDGEGRLICTNKSNPSKFKSGVIHTSTPTATADPSSVNPIPQMPSIQSASGVKDEAGRSLEGESINRNTFASVSELTVSAQPSSEFHSAEGESDSLTQFKKYTIFQDHMYDKLCFHPYTFMKVPSCSELLDVHSGDQSRWAYDLAVMYNRQFNEGSPESVELGAVVREFSNELIDVMSSGSSITPQTVGPTGSKQEPHDGEIEGSEDLAKSHVIKHSQDDELSTACKPSPVVLPKSASATETNSDPNANPCVVFPVISSVSPKHRSMQSSSSDEDSASSSCNLLQSDRRPSDVGANSEDECDSHHTLQDLRSSNMLL